MQLNRNRKDNFRNLKPKFFTSNIKMNLTATNIMKLIVTKSILTKFSERRWYPIEKNPSKKNPLQCHFKNYTIKMFLIYMK
jgi:hypothetical protein